MRAADWTDIHRRLFHHRKKYRHWIRAQIDGSNSRSSASLADYEDGFPFASANVDASSWLSGGSLSCALFADLQNRRSGTASLLQSHL